MDRKKLHRVCVAFFSTVLLLFSAAGCDDDGYAASDTADIPTANHPVPFVADGDYLAVWDGGGYRPLFIKGMNLGVGVPGTQPGELAISDEQYRRWLARMGEMGVNALRIYTLHYPRFYKAINDYNLEHRESPIYLFQGIWLDEENPDPTGDLYGLTDPFDDGIEEVIDSAHGNSEIAHRFGRAYGEYDTDVSPWVIGWLIGREIYPDEMDVTNQYHPEDTTFSGSALSLRERSAGETWATARLDKVITYERDNYGVQRPVSMSSWPTLDPLSHPTEGEFSSEDWITVDLGDIELTDAPAGVYYSYHAYPYYPDFINDEPSYAEYEDEYGVNNYLGYLTALKQHYAGRPLFIAEYGVPSSWGNAHFSLSGMHHGGHDEQTQGRFDGRLIHNIFDAGCGGGMLFAWIDEWWKRTWITDELDMPRSRFPIWWNVTSAEQNFGLIAFEPAGPTYSPVFSSDTGRVREVAAAATNPFFQVDITLDGPLPNGGQLTVGFDTLYANVGESILPDGTQTGLRAELALTVVAPDSAELQVTEAYDLFGIWHGTSGERQRYHTIVTDGAPWMPVRWKNNAEHVSRDGETRYPETEQDIGRLRVRNGAAAPTSLDAVVLDGNIIRVRLPWTLLQFTDPSTMSVMDDDRSAEPRENAVTNGIAMTIAVDNDVVETVRYAWPTWDLAPTTEEREKPALALFSNALEELPTFLDD